MDRQQLLAKAEDHADAATKLLRRSYPEREQAHQMRKVDAHTALAVAYTHIATATPDKPDENTSDDIQS